MPGSQSTVRQTKMISPPPPREGLGARGPVKVGDKRSPVACQHPVI